MITLLSLFSPSNRMSISRLGTQQQWGSRKKIKKLVTARGMVQHNFLTPSSSVQATTGLSYYALDAFSVWLSKLQNLYCGLAVIGGHSVKPGHLFVIRRQRGRDSMFDVRMTNIQINNFPIALLLENVANLYLEHAKDGCFWLDFYALKLVSIVVVGWAWTPFLHSSRSSMNRPLLIHKSSLFWHNVLFSTSPRRLFSCSNRYWSHTTNQKCEEERRDQRHWTIIGPLKNAPYRLHPFIWVKKSFRRCRVEIGAVLVCCVLWSFFQ
jgi:hypothetical protein